MVISIDLDTICHCRWASGATHSKWPDARTALRAVYGQDRPGDEFTEAITWTLELFAIYQIKATFFILSEVAEWVPDVVREIAQRGHEIALHGAEHLDNDIYTPEEFRTMIRESRKTLSSIAGVPVVGYRAPNLIMDAAKLRVLEEEGFLYDSSICPSRRFFGKYANMTHAPNFPYSPSPHDLTKSGGKGIVELPIPVFPILRIPAAVGIMTRVISGWWTRLAIAISLRQNYAMYYFHPYEVALTVPLRPDSLYVKIFCRNIGYPLRRFLTQSLISWRGKVTFVTAHELALLTKGGQ